MKILVLGGTRFLSRAVAEEAVARGHQVACACRGSSGRLPDGVTHMAWDRSEEAPAGLADGGWDAVVDVARLPSHVRRAVEAVPDTHWVFVSTISVYPDDDTPGTPETLRVHEPLAEDVDLDESPEAYGRMKVACEQLVTDGAASSLVIRPGLIVGPGDPSGRFTYWAARLAEGGEVLAPGTPDDVVQVIDVRDLAEWLVTVAEERITGVYDAVGEIQSLESLLGAVASGVGATPRLTWLPQEFLTEQGVEPWSGDDSVPLWLPRPDYDGMMAHDPAPALAAGLWLRPIDDTARDTAAWLAATPDAVRTGISRQREAELLAAWAASLRR
ncbi:epimerase [Nocardioides gansuensis]|uniref:Epimerase n=1 Tax=Nocardioides gansuensis TaxID=2138300 RepID=A0A2T8FEX4_9ACTN|nr:NAD-dependent epimerase/dehydratase family protein [Nocardioides gansuensis]PVG84271.1 epimerase [Nocardioides gansuensis]